MFQSLTNFSGDQVRLVTQLGTLTKPMGVILSPTLKKNTVLSFEPVARISPLLSIAMHVTMPLWGLKTCFSASSLWPCESRNYMACKNMLND